MFTKDIMKIRRYMTLVSSAPLPTTIFHPTWAKNDCIKIIKAKKDNFHLSRPNFLIGLIELATPVQFTKSIQPAMLPENCDELDPFELAYAAGNGVTEANKMPTEQTLRQGFFITMLREECENKIGSGIPNTISLICAESVEERHVGSGDSGN